MQASYFIANRGNSAIQEECWIIDVDAAKKAAAMFDCSPGSYWSQHLAKPVRRAVRSKQTEVRITTGGFSTGDVYNALRAIGCEVAERASF